jgi:hypothetical protein
LEVKTPCSFETSGTRYPVMRCRIKEEVLNHAVVNTSRHARWYLISKLHSVTFSSFIFSLGTSRFKKFGTMDNTQNIMHKVWYTLPSENIIQSCSNRPCGLNLTVEYQYEYGAHLHSTFISTSYNVYSYMNMNICACLYVCPYLRMYYAYVSMYMHVMLCLYLTPYESLLVGMALFTCCKRGSWYDCPLLNTATFAISIK